MRSRDVSDGGNAPIVSSRLLRVLTATLLTILVAARPVVSQVLLNEYLSANFDGIVDEDGDLSDWLEIFNGGAEGVNLLGYGLSDESDEPFKWVFPEVVLPAQSRLLIFASDKNRTTGSGHAGAHSSGAGQCVARKLGRLRRPWHAGCDQQRNGCRSEPGRRRWAFVGSGLHAGPAQPVHPRRDDSPGVGSSAARAADRLRHLR